jgi:methionine synthase II (cobalamin-independent)
MSFEIPRAEVIGSMLRPDGLKQARARAAAGELEAAELGRATRGAGLTSRGRSASALD